MHGHEPPIASRGQRLAPTAEAPRSRRTVFRHRAPRAGHADARHPKRRNGRAPTKAGAIRPPRPLFEVGVDSSLEARPACAHGWTNAQRRQGARQRERSVGKDRDRMKQKEGLRPGCDPAMRASFAKALRRLPARKCGSCSIGRPSMPRTSASSARLTLPSSGNRARDCRARTRCRGLRGRPRSTAKWRRRRA